MAGSVSIRALLANAFGRWIMSSEVKSPSSATTVGPHHWLRKSWSRRLYIGLLGLFLIRGVFPAYNHWKIGWYERLREEIRNSGGRAPRAGGGSVTDEDAYWTALGGDFSNVAIRYVEYPFRSAVDPRVFNRLRDLAELESLTLEGTTTDKEVGQMLGAVANLAVLRLGYSNVSDESLVGIENLSGLERLDLRSTAISDKSVDRLAQLKTLVRLDITETDITSQGASRLSKALPQTQILHRTWPSSKHRDAFRELFERGASIANDGAGGCSVYLTRKDWKGDVNDFSKLQDLEGVRCVQVTELELSPELLTALAAMENLPMLVLSGCDLTDRSLEILGRSHSIERIELYQAVIDGQILSKIAACDRLVSLQLGNVEVRAGALDKLAGAMELRELIVIQSRIANTSLDEFRLLPQLRKLDLFIMPLTDADLAKVSHLQQLRSLSVNSDKVTDGSVPHLAQMTSLRQLLVAQTSITPSGQSRLQTALPKCNVHGASSRLPWLTPDQVFTEPSEEPGPSE